MCNGVVEGLFKQRGLYKINKKTARLDHITILLPQVLGYGALNLSAVIVALEFSTGKRLWKKNGHCHHEYLNGIGSRHSAVSALFLNRL